jgi:multiple sugar transport system permease protein
MPPRPASGRRCTSSVMTPTHEADHLQSSLTRPRFTDRNLGIMLSGPTTLVLLVIVGGPALGAVWFSLQSRPVGGVSSFAGLGNYARLLESQAFRESLITTVTYASALVVLSTVLGLAFALLLNERVRGGWLARTLLIIPWASPWVVVGIMWKWFADSDVGYLNGALFQLGLIQDYIPFLAQPLPTFVLTVVAGAWRQASLSGLLLLAAMQSVPRDPVDAASVDGANAWQRLRFVILPELRPVLMVVIVTNAIVGFFQFDLIFAMTEGGPGTATQLISLLLFRQLFQFTNLEIGSAITVIMGLVAFACGALLIRSASRSADS